MSLDSNKALWKAYGLFFLYAGLHWGSMREWTDGFCIENISMFTEQCALGLSCPDTQFLHMIIWGSLKEAEPHNQLSITETLMNMNISKPVRLRVLRAAALTTSIQ